MKTPRREPATSSSYSSLHPTPPTSNVSEQTDLVDDHHHHQGINGAENEQDGASSMGSYEEVDWGIVSDDDGRHGDDARAFPPAVERTSHDGDDRRSGVLILSGDEDSAQESLRRHPSQVSVEKLYLTAADLSYPGTDSLPTDIDSLDVSETRLVSGNNSLCSTGPTHTPGSEFDGVHPVNNGTAKRSLLLLTLAAFSILSTLLSAYLAWDRHSWRASALRLEEELNQLRMDIRNHSDVLLYPLLNETHPQKVVLADNCWVHAEAEVSFGDCASEIKANVKDVSHYLWSFGETVWSAMSTVKNSSTQSRKEGFFMEGCLPQNAGFTLDGISEVTSLLASVTVAAGEMVKNVVSDVDGYVLHMVNVTRDAIQDASLESHLGG